MTFAPDTFDWNCAEECSDADPSTPPCGNVIVAGEDAAGQISAYGNCAIDLIADPEPGSILYGTHRLTDDQLHEIYGETLDLPDPDINYRYESWLGDDEDGNDPDITYLAVAVDEDREKAFLLSPERLLFILRNPRMYDGMISLYGTHVLPPEEIEYWFPHDPE